MGPSIDKLAKVQPYLLNRAQRRKIKYTGHGALAPIDLGIKKYKKEHPGQTRRVIYFKTEMWKAFHELKGKHTHGE